MYCLSLNVAMRQYQGKITMVGNGSNGLYVRSARGKLTHYLVIRSQTISRASR